MNQDLEKELRFQIIDAGLRLRALHMVVASSGNLSARLDSENILITASGTSLGNLTESDIIKVNIIKPQSSDKPMSSEFPLHRLIYLDFPAKVIVHCHPPLTNGYFAVYPKLKPLTFESRLFLGEIPVVNQDSPTVTKPELVVEALKSNSIVVLKNHGVVVMAENFQKAINLVEELEEAVKVVALARLFEKTICDDLDKALKQELEKKSCFSMFSLEHIQAIVDLVNQDEFIAQKGKEMDLTLKLAIKIEGRAEIYKFNFEKGKIVRLDFDLDAPFVISASEDVWREIFLGRLDPFVATTQGRMKLKGDLGSLSRWYVPFSRLFELFKQVKIA